MKKSKEEKQFELIIQLHGGGGNPLKKIVKEVKRPLKSATKAVTKAATDVVGTVTGAKAAEKAAEKAAGQAAAQQELPTMRAAAAIESATDESREMLRNRLREAKGKNYTNITNSSVGQSTMQSIKKSLLGE